MFDLRIRQLRYEFSFPGEISLHHDVPTITFRGAFGYALAQVIARELHIPELSDQVNLYRDVFMPVNDGDKDSRNYELARPFILRGWYSRPDKRSFILDVNLFGAATEFEPFFDKVIEVMAFTGIGKNRQICKLLKIFSRDVTLDDPDPEPFMTVDFLTPCARLKSGGEVFRQEIPFYVLFARLADRINELAVLYEKNVCIDEDKVHELKLSARDILWKKIHGGIYRANRTSGRTGQQMKLDGFVGQMGYYGDFEPFRGYLKYLPHINLGRFNVFGCGWCDMKFCKEIINKRGVLQ